MKLVFTITFFALLAVITPAHAAGDTEHTWNSTWMFPEHKEWLTCQSDDECTIFFTRHCGIMVGVNKNYAKQAKEEAVASDKCTAPTGYPNNTVSKCVNNTCVMIGSWPK